MRLRVVPLIAGGENRESNLRTRSRGRLGCAIWLLRLRSNWIVTAALALALAAAGSLTVVSGNVSDVAQDISAAATSVLTREFIGDQSFQYSWRRTTRPKPRPTSPSASA